MASQTPTLQQNWQSSEKSQNFKEKTQYLMDILYKWLTFSKGELFLPVDQQHNLKIQMKYRFEISLILSQGHYVI